jgi:hypothetical protein
MVPRSIFIFLHLVMHYAQEEAYYYYSSNRLLVVEIKYPQSHKSIIYGGRNKMETKCHLCDMPKCLMHAATPFGPSRGQERTHSKKPNPHVILYQIVSIPKYNLPVNFLKRTINFNHPFDQKKTEKHPSCSICLFSTIRLSLGPSRTI